MNQIALALIEEFEKPCALRAYRDPGGVWTIGWGQTAGVVEGMEWTQGQADQARDEEIARLDGECRQLAPGRTDGQIGALVDFAYNDGLTALESSHLIILVQVNATFLVVKEFLRWDHEKIDGVEVESKGLLRRRLAEALAYLVASP